MLAVGAEFGECRPERSGLLVAEIVAFMSDVSGGGGTQHCTDGVNPAVRVLP